MAYRFDYGFVILRPNRAVMPSHESESLEVSSCKRMLVSSLVDMSGDEDQLFEMCTTATECLEELRSRGVDVAMWKKMVETAFDRNRCSTSQIKFASPCCSSTGTGATSQIGRHSFRNGSRAKTWLASLSRSRQIGNHRQLSNVCFCILEAEVANLWEGNG